MNPVVSKFTPTITRLIRMDHAHVISQYHQLQPDTSKAVREAVTSNLCTALEIHAQLEESIFYPALHEAGIELAALDRSVPEHEEMRRLIDTVRALPADDPGHAPALAELMRCVMHHVAEEEAVVLPAAESRLADRLHDLGLEMTEARLKLAQPTNSPLGPAHAAAALVTAGAAVAGLLVARSMRRRRDSPLQ